MRVGAISIVHKKSVGGGNLATPNAISNLNSKRYSVVMKQHSMNYKSITPLNNKDFKSGVFQGLSGQKISLNP